MGPNGEVIVGLGKGSFFGEIALLHNVRRTATVVSETYCNVLVLEKLDFEEVCEYYPLALEKIWQAAFDRMKVIVMEELRQNQQKFASARRRSSISDQDGATRNPSRQSLTSHPDSPRTNRRRSTAATFHSKGTPTSTRRSTMANSNGDETAMQREVTEQDVQAWILSRQNVASSRRNMTNSSIGSSRRLSLTSKSSKRGSISMSMGRRVSALPAGGLSQTGQGPHSDQGAGADGGDTEKKQSLPSAEEDTDRADGTPTLTALGITARSGGGKGSVAVDTSDSTPTKVPHDDNGNAS
eukprot:TRINITY_DN1437_c0_g1_i1.p1 TRINITY_DN1437_c0_g1~~TRINITY_DN1437_c0_g1_i1.p1  ORF type:complete len:297 (+),score=51.48 TRINITY_DN1437_c0_g1_i1:1-891(+)